MKINQKTKIVLSVTATILLVTPLFFKQEKSMLDVSEVYNTQRIKSSLVSVKDTDVIYVKCKFKDAGVLHNSLKNHGISPVLSDIIFRKIGNLSPYETSKKLRKLGIRNLQATAYSDDFEFSFSVLKDHVEDALKFIAQAIVHPTFSENDLEYVKCKYPNVVDLETSSIDVILHDELMQMLYPQSPYGLNPTGSAQAINSLKSADLYEFIKKNLTKKKADVLFVGDISRFDAAQYLSILLENIPDGETSEPNFEASENNESSKSLSRKDMCDVEGVALGIRLDNLSDVQKAAAIIVIRTIFSKNGDFSSSLKKENIVAVSNANFYEHRYSSIFQITSYVRKKDAEKFINFLKNKLKKYFSTQNLRQLKAYQNYYEKLSKVGATNFENVDGLIMEKDLPYSDISSKDFSDICQRLFDLKCSKIITISSN